MWLGTVGAMPDTGAPSEFGGAVGVTGLQPSPHTPTPSETLSLLYRTGDPSGASVPDEGETMLGLNPEDVQRALRQQAGDLDKGQVWEEMLQSAEPQTEVEELG